MEIFELKYFLAVAATENVNKAAQEINISAGSLSKAISRLESELQTPLFYRSGRGILLTPAGVTLKKRAAHLLQLEEDARVELTGKGQGALNVRISSEEILQSSFGVELASAISDLYPQARIQFLIRNEETSIQQVMDNEAQFAIITSEPPAGVSSRTLAKVEFRTCAAKTHPLLKEYSSSQIIPVEKILHHPFAAPDSAMLGRITKSSSLDGWRDDKFPRTIRYMAGGLKLMENLIANGLALGYLPDHFVTSAGLVPLKISGCPYSCHQTVRLIAKDPGALGWMDKVWRSLKA